jgi:hypothetical protein
MNEEDIRIGDPVSVNKTRLSKSTQANGVITALKGKHVSWSDEVIEGYKVFISDYGGFEIICDYTDLTFNTPQLREIKINRILE